MNKNRHFKIYYDTYINTMNFPTLKYRHLESNFEQRIMNLKIFMQYATVL